MVVIFVDHYSVLGLPTGEKGLNLSSKDIKKGYKLKALQLHPDKKPNNPNAVADFQKLQASFDVLKDEYARNVFNNELMIRLREQGERFVASVVKESFVERTMAEMRKRKKADEEFEEMRRRESEKRERERDSMSAEYEKAYREAGGGFTREQWEKKVRREAKNVYRDNKSLRKFYARRSVDTLFYDILRLRKGGIYV